MHFSEEKERFIAVRQLTGGGTTSISMPRGNSTMSDILEEARKLFQFFPGGESTYGYWLEIDYSLANFKGDKIEKLRTHEGEETDFTLQSYFDLYKLTRIRLYLTTRQRRSPPIQWKEEQSETLPETSELKGKSLEKAKLTR